MKKTFFYLQFLLIILTLFNLNCGVSDRSAIPNPNPDPTPAPAPQPQPQPLDPACKKTALDIHCVFDFNSSDQGWITDFADYYLNPSTPLELKTEYILLPVDVCPPDQEMCEARTKSIMISGYNKVDDLFIYLKKKITGLDPQKKYQITFEVRFASQAPSEGGGIGGSPGLSVFLKVGSTSIEPLTLPKEESGLTYYRMNIDKGNGQAGGADMITIGDIAVREKRENFCPKNGNIEQCKYRFLNRDNLNNPFPVKTDLSSLNPIQPNEKGELWVIMGTDSGYEGKTTLYYDEVKIHFLDQMN